MNDLAKNDIKVDVDRLNQAIESIKDPVEKSKFIKDYFEGILTPANLKLMTPEDLKALNLLIYNLEGLDLEEKQNMDKALFSEYEKAKHKQFSSNTKPKGKLIIVSSKNPKFNCNFSEDDGKEAVVFEPDALKTLLESIPVDKRTDVLEGYLKNFYDYLKDLSTEELIVLESLVKQIAELFPDGTKGFSSRIKNELHIRHQNKEYSRSGGSSKKYSKRLVIKTF